MSLLLYPKFQAPKLDGANLSGGKVNFYITSTTTRKDTYSDAALSIVNANPVVLDARGEADIYLNGVYKIILTDKDDVEIWTDASFTGLFTGVAGDGNLGVLDDKTINIGTGNDIQMTYVSATPLGTLTVLQSASGHFNFLQEVDSGLWRFYNDDTGGTSRKTFELGGVTPTFKGFYNGTEVFAGTSTGVNIPDDKAYSLGAAEDISLKYTSGTSLGTLTVLSSAAGHFNFLQEVNTGLWRFFNDDSGGTSRQTWQLGGNTPTFTGYHGGTSVLTGTTTGIELPSTTTPGLKLNDGTAFTSIYHDQVTGGLVISADDGNATANSDIKMYVDGILRATITAGLIMGAPTGGDKGTGTINAVGVYDDNVLLTDYVFDYELDGKINADDKAQAKQFLSNTDVLDVDYFSNFWKVNRHLPSLPSRAEWEEDGAHSIGKLAQRLWETIELQAVHIESLNARIKKLEGK